MALGTALEVERTFEFDPSAAPPELLGVAGVAGVRRLEEEHLDATYYDTEDLRLARRRTTLRSRRGGRDAGWHLKLPVGPESREELTLPLEGSTEVPTELMVLVRSLARSAPLQPVVRVVTHRTVCQLLDPADRVLAELADDRVTAQLLGTQLESIVWRELEVELVAGDEALLDAVGSRLQALGAVAASRPSKLARALGDRLPVPSKGLPRRATAADAMLAHLRAQVAELVGRDPAVRLDRPDGVHKMRVATRRLRSALKTYRPLLDRAVSDPLRSELKHLAGVLGAARDAEVLREQLTAQVAGLPPELVLGPVAARIKTELGRQYRDAHARVVAELDGQRYATLLDGLDGLLDRFDGLLDAAPRSGAGPRPARRELARLVRRTVGRLDQAAAAAAAAPSAEQRNLRLHEVRKAAKQVRYAAESTAAVLGSDAAAFAGLVERVQEVLGEFQDSVVARARLRLLGVQAHLAGENGFTFGLLLGLEQARGERALAAYLPAWQAASRKGARRWLR